MLSIQTADSALLTDEALQILEENLWSLWSNFGQGADCMLYQTAESLWIDTPLKTLPYNAVLRSWFLEDVETHLDKVFAHYQQRNRPFVWFVHPSMRPTDLDIRLAIRGMTEVEVCAGMVMDLDELMPQLPAPQGINVREVCSLADYQGLLHLVARRWKIPDNQMPTLFQVMRPFGIGTTEASVRCWVAWYREIPIAKVVLHRTGNVAGLYGVATIQGFRGQGLARLLTLEALHAARQEGATFGVLHATPMAEALYRKVGFQKLRPFASLDRQISHPKHAGEYSCPLIQ